MYADEESYNSGHGHTYDAYGVNSEEGALVVVRPDHCELCPPVALTINANDGPDVAKVAALGEVDSIQQFFEGFLVQSGI